MPEMRAFRALSLPFSQSARNSVANDGIESSGRAPGPKIRDRTKLKKMKNSKNQKYSVGIQDSKKMWRFWCSRCHFRNLREIPWRMMASRALGMPLVHVFRQGSTWPKSARHSSKSGPMAPKCETFVIFKPHGPKMRDIRQNQALESQNARHSSKSGCGEPKCETVVKIQALESQSARFSSKSGCGEHENLSRCCSHTLDRSRGRRIFWC